MDVQEVDKERVLAGSDVCAVDVQSGNRPQYVRLLVQERAHQRMLKRHEVELAPSLRDLGLERDLPVVAGLRALDGPPAASALLLRMAEQVLSTSAREGRCHAGAGSSSDAVRLSRSAVFG